MYPPFREQAKWPAAQGSARALRAFSLVEVITVSAVVMLLMTLAAPITSSLISSRSAASAARKLSMVLDGARQYAIAQNTYAWVVIRPYTSEQGLTCLDVAVLGTRDGTFTRDGQDRFTWSGENIKVEGKDSNLTQVGEVVTLENVTITEPGDLRSRVPESDGGNRALASQPHGTGPSFSLMGDTKVREFTRAIVFNPNGSARVNQSISGVIEIGVEAAPRRREDNAVAIHVSPLTGQVRMFTPRAL